ncbi:MAG: hypothetical protein AB7G28_18345 [Pirellulales bacterium]
MQRIEFGLARQVSFAFLFAATIVAVPGLSDAAQEDAAPAAATNATALATPTHHQTGLIKANVAGMPDRSLKCFCLTPDNRIVAGCAGGAGELRVFDEAGEFVESWAAPFEPEAIYVRADGKIFLAGAGKLARLSSTGEVELERPAPHAESMGENLEKIRADVIEQRKQQAEMFVSQAKQYDEMIERTEKQAADLEKQLADLGEVGDAGQKKQLEQQLAMQRQMKQQYEQVKKQWDEMVARQKPKELTESEIDELVEQSIQYKRQASSISATEGEVFLTTHASVGYGFDVWKMDADFAGGRTIITGLSGCCGQMDVKASGDGLFVAENSKHRVCRYNGDGELICNWGHGARKGIEGFGSCCNPMNVAFGPEGAVYTAEDNTGRIKRYSPDGNLLGLVGSVDLVPGCKNCSIAVNSDGSRVYMLDITRGHIVRMEPFKPGEAPAPAAVEDEEAVEEDPLQQSASYRVDVIETDVGGTVAKGVMKLLGYGD